MTAILKNVNFVRRAKFSFTF